MGIMKSMESNALGQLQKQNCLVFIIDFLWNYNVLVSEAYFA